MLLCEHAPRAFRGGNSRHTRNLRGMHEKPTDVLTEQYFEDEYWDDLRRVIVSLSRTNAFFLGGGKALVNAYYLTAELLGVDILYDTEVTALQLDDGFVRSASLRRNGFPKTARAKCVVASAGGFQANLEWMREHWGAAVDNFVIRGTPYNRGRILKKLLDQGVAQVGRPGRRSEPVPGRRSRRAPTQIRRRHRHATGQRSRQHRLNRDGDRFYDEGEDV